MIWTLRIILLTWFQIYCDSKLCCEVVIVIKVISSKKNNADSASGRNSCHISWSKAPPSGQSRLLLLKDNKTWETLQLYCALSQICQDSLYTAVQWRENKIKED